MSLITCTNVGSGQNDTDQAAGASIYATSSMTFETGKLHIATFCTRQTGGNQETMYPYYTTAVSGLDANRGFRVTSQGTGTNLAFMEMWAFTGDGRTDTISVGAAAGGGVSWVNAHTCFHWIVDKFDNVELGPGSTYAVVQNKNSAPIASQNTATVTFDNAFSRAKNGVYAVMSLNLNENITAGSGFTEKAETTGAAPAHRINSEFRADNNTTASWSWTTNTANVAIIALELAGSRFPKTIS